MDFDSWRIAALVLGAAAFKGVFSLYDHIQDRRGLEYDPKQKAWVKKDRHGTSGPG